VITTEGQEANAAQEGAPSENNGERRERRSRDRYGRDRRERAGEPRQDNVDEEAQGGLNVGTATAPVAEASGEDRPAPRSYFERAQQASAAPVAVATEPAAASNEAPQAPAFAAPLVPAAEAPAPVPVAVTPPAPPAAAPTVAARTGLPSVANYTLEINSLQQVAQGSGLVWVNSDAAKVAAVQAAIAAEPQPVRVPRERPPAVVLDEGPLVLVETRKDLKDMNLPF
jgi:ribonuclease E